MIVKEVCPSLKRSPGRNTNAFTFRQNGTRFTSGVKSEIEALPASKPDLTPEVKQAGM